MGYPIVRFGAGQRLGWETVERGETYRVNCPFCNDGRKRLNICHVWGVREQCSGDDRLHLAHCFNENCLRTREKQKELRDQVFPPMACGFRPRVIHANEIVQGAPAQPIGLLHKARPPGTLVPLLKLPADHPAVRYMVGERRYTPQMLQEYSVSLCIEADQKYRPAAHRIVFPIYFNGEYVGWQARTIGNPKSHDCPKYYTMPGFPKSRVLYNYDVAKSQSFVVVVEGVTDAHKVGHHAVACFGKSVSRHQRDLLKVGSGKPIVLMLDADAQEENRKLAVELSHESSRQPIVSIALPDGHDPANFDRLTIWNVIAAQARARGVPLTFF